MFEVSIRFHIFIYLFVCLFIYLFNYYVLKKGFPEFPNAIGL